MSTDVPLLSSYKKEFVRRRFLHTLTGVKLFVGRTPCAARVVQLVLWLVPAGVGACSSLLLPVLPALLVSGGTVALFTLSLQIGSRYLQLRREDGEERVLEQSSGEEEDDLFWDGIAGSNTWSFLVPAKQFTVNIFLHSFGTGVLTASSTYFLQDEIIKSVIPGPSWPVVLVFGWMTTCLGVQAMMVAPPPETATFRHVDIAELNSFSRPLHILLCHLPNLLWQHLGHSSLHNPALESSSNLQLTALVAYWVHASLPLLWPLGVLPPVEPLLLWLGEQVLVFVLGGSPAASSWRLSIYLALSTLQVIVILLATSSTYQALVVAAISGYVLSMDLIGIATQPFGKTQLMCGPHQQSMVNVKSKKANMRRTVSSFVLMAQDALAHVISIAFCTIVVIFVPGSHSGEPSIAFVLGWIVIGLFIFIKITNEAQKVFFCSGSIRSPLYSTSTGLAELVWQNFRSLLLPLASGLVMLAMVADIAGRDDLLQSRINASSRSGWRLVELLAIIRTLRWIWQNTDHALFELSIFQIIHYFLLSLKNENAAGIVDYIHGNISQLQQLVVLSFIVDRADQIVNKVYLFFCLTATSVEERASKRSYAICLFQMNMLFFPVVLAIIVISSIMAAPLLSFFTLPFFFLTFPRPGKFWPGKVGSSAAISDDSIYYEQVCPRAITAVHQAARVGQLGTLHPGSQLLIRHQDRIMWIQVLEKGNGYLTYCLKGMELQETSCHSLEATRIDDIFDATFEKETKLNQFLFHMVTPLRLLKFPMYSDTRNVLTGVIDSPESLKYIAESFSESLVWFLLRRAKEHNQQEAEPVPTPPSAKADSSNNSELAEPSHQNTVMALSPENASPEVDSGLVFAITGQAGNLESWPTSTESSQSPSQRFSWTRDSEQPFSWSGDRDWMTKSAGPITSTKYLGRRTSDISLDMEEEHHRVLPPVRVVAPHSRRRSSQDSFTDQLDSIIPGIIDPLDVIRTPIATKRNTLLPTTPSTTTVITPAKQKKHSVSVCGDASQYLPPLDWLACAGLDQSEAASRWFPQDLYQHLLSGSPGAKDDLNLRRSLTALVTSICQTVYGPGSSPGAAMEAGPSLVVKAFNGMSCPSWPEELHEVVLRAYRAGVKLALDKILLGDMDVEEVVDTLEDVAGNWYIGLEGEDMWAASVLKEVPNLFSLTNANAHGETERNMYRSHLLHWRECSVAIGRLNAEVVRSLWASLSLELLYLTNDDEERYSIQAEERLLRNLTVQAADPPLGYPIYSSPAITRRINWM